LKNKKIQIFIFFTLILNIKLITAFISPNSFNLILNALGSIFWNILIIIVTALLIWTTKFYKIIKLKKIKKKILYCILIFILITTIIFVKKYSEISANNSIIKNNEKISKYYENKWNNFIIENNITKLSNNLYNSESFNDSNNNYSIKYTTKANLTKAFNNSKVKIISIQSHNFSNVIKSDYYKIIQNANNLSYIEKYFLSLDINRNDEILFICHWGFMSKITSMISNVYGYNSKYASLYNQEEIQLDFSKYLDYYFNSKSNTKIIIKEIKDYSSENYIFLFFDENDQYMLFNEKLVHNAKKLILINYEKDFSILPIDNKNKKIEKEYFDNLIKNPKTKIICSLSINCFLTREFLEFHNINVKTIYKVHETQGFNESEIINIDKIMDKFYVLKWEN
jgi:hypothetical protein